MNYCLIVLPRSVTPVIQTTAFDSESVSPSLEEVIASLKAHGVSAEGKSMNVSRIISIPIL